MTDKDKGTKDTTTPAPPEKVVQLFRRRGAGGKKAGSASEAEMYMNKMRERASLSTQESKDAPMTVEETLFVQAMADGCSLSEAYKRAFPLDECDKKEAYDKGRTISLRSNVASSIVELVDANRMWEQHAGKRLRLFIARQLEDISATSPNDAARISALEKLGKLDHVRAFEERKQAEDAVDPAQIMAEIKKRITQMGGNKG